MKIEQESDKRLLMTSSGIYQVGSGILLICLSIAMVLSIMTNGASLWLWLPILAFFGVGVLLIVTSSDKHTLLVVDGLSAVTETKVVSGRIDRLDFRTGFVTGVCLDTGEHYMAVHPSPSKLPRFFDRFYQSALYLEISDGSNVLLARQLPLFKLSIAASILPKIGITSLDDQAHKISLFLKVPLRNLTLPNTSDLFGNTRQVAVAPSEPVAPPPQASSPATAYAATAISPPNPAPAQVTAQQLSPIPVPAHESNIVAVATEPAPPTVPSAPPPQPSLAPIANQTPQQASPVTAQAPVTPAPDAPVVPTPAEAASKSAKDAEAEIASKLAALEAENIAATTADAEPAILPTSMTEPDK